tara:strand:+ start:3315 stop:4541 length:1227 start_codon:yes stop_codon:yes gene_type:complete
MEGENFVRVLDNFITDIDNSFPEFDIKNIVPYNDLEDENNILLIEEHCKKIYPEKFFDILYQNEKIFDEDIELLENINFKLIWQSNISEETKKVIWKYLQIILFHVIKQVNDPSKLGNSAQLFEFIDNDDFKEKILNIFSEFSVLFNKDTSNNSVFGDISNNPLFEDMSNNPLFGDMSNNPLFGDMSGNKFFGDMSGNFDADEIHKHIFKLLDGNIGKLAKELAEDTLKDLLDELDCDKNDQKALFEALIKDPNKLIKIMKKLSEKIEGKIKSGEVNQDELIMEAAEMMKNMKNMPGMEDMLKKVAKQQGGGGAKGKAPSMDSIEANLQSKLKASKQRARMLEKLNKKKEEDGVVDLKSIEMNENKEEENEMGSRTIEEILKSFSEDTETEKPKVKSKGKGKGKKKKN